MSSDVLSSYLSGIDDLKTAVRGLTREQLVARPVEGRWSVLEVVCHLADSEGLFAERMKRILAEDRPALAFADPALFSAALAYQDRDAETEVAFVELSRKQMASILRAVDPSAMTRIGLHSKDGPVTLEQILAKCVAHLAHHLRFVHEKRKALELLLDS